MEILKNNIFEMATVILQYFGKIKLFSILFSLLLVTFCFTVSGIFHVIWKWVENA